MSLSVALYFYGTDLKPERVTQRMTISPTSSRTRGEKIVGEKTGTVVIPKIGLWMLQTSSKSNDLSDHISELLSHLALAEIDDVRTMPGVQDAKIDVYVVENCGKDITLGIAAGQLLELGSKGLRLDLTFGSLSS
jgi:hypothetical protein